MPTGKQSTPAPRLGAVDPEPLAEANVKPSRHPNIHPVTRVIKGWGKPESMQTIRRRGLMLVWAWLIASIASAQQPKVHLKTFSWKPSRGKLLFEIEFDHDAESYEIHDDMIEQRYWYVDFRGVDGPKDKKQIPFDNNFLRRADQIYYPQFKVMRFVFYVPNGFSSRISLLGKERLFGVTVEPLRLQPLEGVTPDPVKKAKKLVVIDPGHGGKSSGARSAGKLGGKRYREKDLVLQIAKRIVPLFEKSPNLEVRLSRTEDDYVALDDRIKFADEAGADLFASIHLNASPVRSKTAQGFEVYYLSDGTRETNRTLEALENEHAIEGDQTEQIMGILKSLANEIFETRRSESREFCQILNDLFRSDGPFKGRSRGVKSARFRVLMNYNMPSVLLECGFIDSKKDGALLIQSKVQNQIAALLFNAINLYFTREDPNFQGYLAPVR